MFVGVLPLCVHRNYTSEGTKGSSGVCMRACGELKSSSGLTLSVTDSYSRFLSKENPVPAQ